MTRDKRNECTTIKHTLRHKPDGRTDVGTVGGKAPPPRRPAAGDQPPARKMLRAGEAYRPHPLC